MKQGCTSKRVTRAVYSVSVLQSPTPTSWQGLSTEKTISSAWSSYTLHPPGHMRHVTCMLGWELVERVGKVVG